MRHAPRLSRRQLMLALPALGLLPACGDSIKPNDSGKQLWLADPQAVLVSPQQELPLTELHDKTLLVFFGYAHCPDICPANLSTIARVLAGLTPEQRAHIRGLFVTLDPARDVAQTLKNYVALFHPDIWALRSTEPHIKQMANAFRVYYVVQKPDQHGAYAVDHTSHTALVRPGGALARLIPHGTPADEMRKQVLEGL